MVIKKTPMPLDDLSDELSPKMRLYLTEVYRLSDMAQTPWGYVGTSVLADLLDVSPPAVNRMINRLKEMGFIEHEPYQGVRLTSIGQREALKQLRYHRIAETFLYQVMHLSWEQLHEEAATLALGLSEVIAERMWIMADQPTHCPHGEPIPTAQGDIEIMHDVWLSTVNASTHVRITRFRTRDPERLKYIAALGLLPNVTLHVLHVAPFNGPLQLKIGHEYRIVGHNLAELIRVMPLAEL